MKNCLFCGKETPFKSRNYCGWDCHVEEAKQNGGILHTPNGLPVKCIRHDGLMMECEHGDHPDYKFPIEVEYIGGEPEFDGFPTETHALIYTDGSVAVSLYECCFAMWYLPSGTFGGGAIWGSGKYRITGESLAKIKEYLESKCKPQLTEK